MGWGEWPEELTTLSFRRRSCPPHGPLMVEAVEEGTYVTRCMRCGLWGPEREDGLQAKEAFDEASKYYP